MRICLYGGTFDPPHNGHLAIAEQCLKNLNIDRAIFIPAFLAPHKTNVKISSAKDRLAMLRLAIQPYPGLEISELEIDRKGISYSIDTIIQIKKALSLNSENLYFLIGADSLAELHTWRQPERILDESRVVVAGRPHYSMDDVPVDYRNRVEILSNPLMDISSTDIRQKVERHESVRHLIPESVAGYINIHKLYRT
ncbi:nicotinate-nucleotide adenylyltransferase [bacterium]|nr:nicotinate-nucleotide adenylyltransferase [bacterium]MBU1065070.1 nicotinate-nucleotide adenylyltransferase [bacterium]MBU1634640.1 nicotinate-nucleotide adenylyltransferase [bacterium]MBU1874675.1 nicotinate-nucleotide adenylyltransferase [bacterium]